MEKVFSYNDNFYAPDHWQYTGPVLKAPDGTTFQITDEMGPYGYAIHRNGKYDKKWNQAIRLYKGKDGNIYSVDNNGTTLIWDGGQWNFLVRDNKVESDIIAKANGETSVFNSTDKQMSDLLLKITYLPEKGGWWTRAEYYAALLQSRRGANKLMVDVGKTTDKPGSGFDHNVRFTGFLTDFRDNGLPREEANAKWETNVYNSPKGADLKILGSAVIGFVTGGPVGAVIGLASGIASTQAQEKAIMNAQEQKNLAVKETVSAAKKIQEAKSQITENTPLQASSNVLGLDNINIGGVEINPLYIGVGLFLLLGVFLIFKK